MYKNTFDSIVRETTIENLKNKNTDIPIENINNSLNDMRFYEQEGRTNSFNHVKHGLASGGVIYNICDKNACSLIDENIFLYVVDKGKMPTSAEILREHSNTRYRVLDKLYNQQNVSVDDFFKLIHRYGFYIRFLKQSLPEKFNSNHSCIMSNKNISFVDVYYEIHPNIKLGYVSGDKSCYKWNSLKKDEIVPYLQSKNKDVLVLEA